MNPTELQKNTELSPGDTAASHMVTRIPRATADARVDDVIDALRGQDFECADTVFVVDDMNRLQGVVRINDLLADGDRRIGDLMEAKHEAVRANADQEKIAVLAMSLDMIAVPVVDSEQRLIGAVPPENLIRILRAEHMEDLQHLAGITPPEHGPIVAFNEPLFDRFRRRLPWLVFGLLASTAVTFVMARFEHSLSINVTVAFFIPALVYIAGAIGTQAVSVAVRGLSVSDISIIRLLKDELAIGSAIGVVLGLISFALVLAAFQDLALSTAVGLAVLAGGTLSAVVGFGLPWVFQRFGADPALGSGPICTIIQDIASLSIYLALVSALMA
jgi:magnesium transporter